MVSRLMKMGLRIIEKKENLKAKKAEDKGRSLKEVNTPANLKMTLGMSISRIFSLLFFSAF